LIGRWPGLYSALNLAILIAANALPFSVAVHDKVSDGRVHPISLWVPVLRIVETFGLIAVAGSCKSGWQRSPGGGPSALRCSMYPGSRFDSERRRAREPTFYGHFSIEADGCGTRRLASASYAHGGGSFPSISERIADSTWGQMAARGLAISKCPAPGIRIIRTRSPARSAAWT
jgi:hypothetical protein